MGTRGALGFFKDGKHKVAYSQFDSYPDGMGFDTLTYCQNTSIQDMNDAFGKIELVFEENAPTDEQRQKLKERTGGKYTDLNVSTQSEDDWYCLLRGAQGDLKAYGEIGFMVDSKEFLNESLFCEWAYIINLDDNVLECYEGFQKSKPKGRYENVEPFSNGYYSVTLRAVYNLNYLPDEKQFLQDMQEGETSALNIIASVLEKKT